MKEARTRTRASAARRRWIQSATTSSGRDVLPSIKRLFETLSIPRWRKVRLQLAWFDMQERPFNASQLLYGYNVEELDFSSPQSIILTEPTAPVDNDDINDDDDMEPADNDDDEESTANYPQFENSVQ